MESVQLTVTCEFPAVAWTPVGVAGALVGVLFVLFPPPTAGCNDPAEQNREQYYGNQTVHCPTSFSHQQINALLVTWRISLCFKAKLYSAIRRYRDTTLIQNKFLKKIRPE